MYHELSFKMTKNDDGDDYHLEFYIYNEYYEVRTEADARDLLKYLKELHDPKLLRHKLKRLNAELKALKEDKQ
jgi:hypothetical protein